MNAQAKAALNHADRLEAARDVLNMLSGLLTAIDEVRNEKAITSLVRIGRYLADDWANTLDVDAEQIRQQVEGGAL